MGLAEEENRRATAFMLLPEPEADRQLRSGWTGRGDTQMPASFERLLFDWAPSLIDIPAERAMDYNGMDQMPDFYQQRRGVEPPAAVTAAPTKDEAVKAGDTIRRYIELYG